MQHYFNTFLRHFWLMLIPIIITPLVVVLLIKPQPSYIAEATLWTEEPLYITPVKNFEGNIYNSTPAERQMSLLEELSRTGDYYTQLLKVFQKNNGIPIITQEAQTAFFNRLNNNWAIKNTSEHLISVKYLDKDPQQAIIIANSMAETFSQVINQRSKDQGAGAVQWLEKQVNDAYTEWQKSYDDWRAYAFANGSYPSETIDHWAMDYNLRNDPKYVAFYQIEEFYRVRYENLKRQLERTRVSYGTLLTGQDQILKVHDQATIISSTTYDLTRRILVGAGMGLLTGLCLVALMVLIITWTDKSWREQKYVQNLITVGTVVTLPELRLANKKNKTKKTKIKKNKTNSTPTTEPAITTNIALTAEPALNTEPAPNTDLELTAEPALTAEPEIKVETITKAQAKTKTKTKKSKKADKLAATKVRKWPAKQYSRYYRVRQLRRKVIVGLACVVTSVPLGVLVALNPSWGLSLLIMTLLVAIIIRWPVAGYFIAVGIALPCELYPIELDHISSFLAQALTNLNAFTPIPLSATPLEVIAALTLLSAIFQAGLRGERFLDRSIMSLEIAFLAGFVLFGYLWGVLAKGGDSKTAQWEFRALWYIPIFYLLTVYFMRDIKLWKPMSWLFPIGLTMLGLISTVRFAVLPMSDSTYSDSLNGLNHDTAILQVILLMWCLSKLCYGGTFGEKITSLSLIVPSLFWIFISNRRAAFAVLAGCFAALMLTMMIRHRKAFIIVSLVLVIVVPVYSAAFSKASGPLGTAARAFSAATADTQSERDYNSDLYRQIERTNVIMTIQKQPLTGIGFGQPFETYLPMIILDGFTFQFYTPHVQVLWVWLKLGMLGWMLFWFIIVNALFKLGQVVKYGQAGVNLNLALTAGFIIISLMIFSYLDISMTNTRFLTVLGLSIGLIEVSYRRVRQQQAAKPEPQIAPETANNHRQLAAAS
jgi:hypothetical protein